MKFPADHSAAIAHLQSTDPTIDRLIESEGVCTLGQQPTGDTLLSALVKSIIYQQISIKAASTVHQRFLALYPESSPTAELILQTPTAEMRQIGLPAAKVAYLKDLATQAIDGLPTIAELATMTDAEIIQRLTQIKGIGRWSVEMLLIFQLQRWDVMPLDDVGLQLAVQEQYQLAAKPSKKALSDISKPWQPYRSIATWYLWRSRDRHHLKLLDTWS